MQRRRFYASDENQPYKPLNDDDGGPYFQCDGENGSPHFHVVGEHPEAGDVSNFIVRQLHVPGYDQHNGNIKKNFSSSPAFNIMTGWHFVDPSTNSHLSEFIASKKYSNTTDNDEALGLWKDECQSTYGNGAFVKRQPTNAKSADDFLYDFLPGKEQPEEYNEKPEEPQQEQEQPEQEQSEQEQGQQAPVNKVPFGLKPGEKAHTIVFYPARQIGDKIKPAFSRTKLFEGHSSASDAQNTLRNYTDKLDMINILHNYKKSEESPDVWEDLYKRSKKNSGWY